MKINGKAIALKILNDLKKRVEKLKEQKLYPSLYVILLSDDPASASYVKQKLLRAAEIGVRIILDKENPAISTEKLTEKIISLNNNDKINGIIIQRPIPLSLDEKIIANAIIPQKDIDGFNKISEFEAPVTMAVFKLLKNIHKDNFENWLRSQRISVLGNGLTAGKPIIKALEKVGVAPKVITSQTYNKEELLQTSDIIISAVGKADILKAPEIKKGAILIGVGLHKEPDGKFHGDYNEDEIAKKALFYSPTPGGVGPVNVAFLLENLVQATENSLKL